jgi:hypothetical protein
MTMELPDFTVEHLKALPLRANVAFAVRCARRVEHLAQLPEGHPQRESRRGAVEAALQMAEAVARGSSTPPDESVIAALDASRGVASGPPGSEDAVAAVAEAAHAAASAWHVGFQETEESGPPGRRTAEARKFLGALEHVTADLAALNAFTAAADAFVSVGYHNQDFVDAALNDYDSLLRLKPGRYPELGAPIDPAPDGPLGPL